MTDAQSTYYYRQTKIVENGVTKAAGTGGQFITFIDGACYESDKKGYSVNSSRLNYNRTENGIKIYTGKSYWKDGVFCFSNDLGRLNVRVGNVVYAYVREAAPAGVTTCSLIREDGEASGGLYPVTIQQPVYGDIGGYTGGSSGSSGASSNPGNDSKPKYTKTCGVCHGTGRCIICAGDGWVTPLSGRNHYCPSCRNHDGRCKSCNGRGTWKE